MQKDSSDPRTEEPVQVIQQNNFFEGKFQRIFSEKFTVLSTQLAFFILQQLAAVNQGTSSRDELSYLSANTQV